MHRHAAVAFAVAIVALIATTGCLGSAVGPTSTSGTDAASGAIRGAVMVAGGPAPGSRPLANSTFSVLRGGRLVATVRTDRHGRFFRALAPGTYRLEWGQGIALLPRKVTVTPTTTVRLALTLSIK